MEAVRVPAVGDPLVVDGTRYRIREIEDGIVRARVHFGRLRVSVATISLAWDKVAGVWRLVET